MDRVAVRFFLMLFVAVSFGGLGASVPARSVFAQGFDAHGNYNDPSGSAGLKASHQPSVIRTANGNSSGTRPQRPPIGNGRPVYGATPSADDLNKITPAAGDQPGETGATDYSDNVNNKEVGDTGTTCDADKDTDVGKSTKTETQEGGKAKTEKFDVEKQAGEQIAVRKGADAQSQADAQKHVDAASSAAAAGDAAGIDKAGADLQAAEKAKEQEGQHAADAKEAAKQAIADMKKLEKVLQKPEINIPKTELDHCFASMLAATKVTDPSIADQTVKMLEQAKTKEDIEALAKELEGGNESARDMACVVHGLVGKVPSYCNSKKSDAGRSYNPDNPYANTGADPAAGQGVDPMNPKPLGPAEQLEQMEKDGTATKDAKGSGVQVSDFGYKGDTTSDSNSNYICRSSECVEACGAGGPCGRGNSSNLMSEDRRSAALSPDLVRKHGMKPGDEFCVGGMCAVYEDTTADYLKNRVDLYKPSFSADVGNNYHYKINKPFVKTGRHFPVVRHPLAHIKRLPRSY